METDARTARPVPTLYYKGRPEVAPSPGAPPGDTPAWLAYLNRGVFGFVLVAWAVVGLVVWVPLVLRSMVRFSLALVPATLRGTSVQKPARRLQAAVEFYRRGFVLVSGAARGEVDPGSGDRSMAAGADRLGRELLWSVAIWYGLLALLGLAPSPVELARAVGALPWDQWAVTVGGWIVGPFVN